MTAEPQLFELHELARERGIDGYRLLSKAELMEAVGDLPPPGPTVVETAAVRDGLAVLTLRGQGGEEIVFSAWEDQEHGVTRVRASTLFFDQALDRFLSTLPLASQASLRNSSSV